MATTPEGRSYYVRGDRGMRMLKLILRRLLTFIPVIFVVGFLGFVLQYITPTSPAQYILGEAATPEAVARVNHALGQDKPFFTQFGHWMWNALQGHLGTSLFSSEPVTHAIMQRLPATLSLSLAALVLSLLIGVSAGTAAALRPGSRTDRVVNLGSSLGLAIPGFWLGILLAYYFAYKLQWFPIFGYTPITDDPFAWLQGIFLPALALAVPAAAIFARHTRNQLTDVLARDYIRTARAKGASRRRIITHHALKNAAMPIVTLAGTTFVALLSGTVIVEQIFTVPGVGSLTVTAAEQKDLPIVQGVVVLAAVAVLIVNLLVDIFNGMLDPRLRTS
jgi:peptide/nickel transport system permease protein